MEHENAVFDDQVVYATGHYYRNCEFSRCTIVVTAFPFAFDTCVFRGCNWHLNIVLHDKTQAQELARLLDDPMIKSIPSPPGANDTSAD